jgi:uncharacterized protein (TIGR01777 family)
LITQSQSLSIPNGFLPFFVGMATILITGGTGLIGTALAEALVKEGNEVIILSRKRKSIPAGPVSYAVWNVDQQTIDRAAIGKADYVVHLAGANVADKRWTKNRKKEIMNSRVKSGELLVKALKEIPNKIKAVISSSATGFYGPDPGIPNARPFVESDPPANDFLAAVVQQWEATIQQVTALNKRLVILRTGIVLSDKGGAYAEFKKPLKFGLASVLGNGKQMISWIHIQDLVRLYLEAMKNEDWQGAYNAVSPNPVCNKRMIAEMARQSKKWHVTVPVPAFVLKAVLGEMSIEVLKSTTVSAAKIENTGFRFLFPTIEQAIQNLRAS